MKCIRKSTWMFYGFQHLRNMISQDKKEFYCIFSKSQAILLTQFKNCVIRLAHVNNDPIEDQIHDFCDYYGDLSPMIVETMNESVEGREKSRYLMYNNQSRFHTTQQLETKFLQCSAIFYFHDAMEAAEVNPLEFYDPFFEFRYENPTAILLITQHEKDFKSK